VKFEADWDSRPALGVVMTAAGYPGAYRKGDVIEGLPRRDEELGDDREAVPRRDGRRRMARS
jgi:phosphoribosylamine--glycine ligase